MESLDRVVGRYQNLRNSITYRRFRHQADLFYQRLGIADTMARRNLRKAVRLGLTYVLESDKVKEEDKKLLGELIVKLGDPNLQGLLGC